MRAEQKYNRRIEIVISDSYWTGNSSYFILVTDWELEVCVVNSEVNFGMGALELCRGGSIAWLFLNCDADWM
jgi:hypothetical protein